MYQERKLKVALLQSPTYPLRMQLHGGAERGVLARLKILNDKGHHADLFVPSCDENAPNVKKLINILFKNRFLKWTYFLHFAIMARKYDVCHGGYTPELLTLLPDKGILHFHGLAVTELPLYRIRFFKNRYHRAMYTFCARWVMIEYQKKYPEIPKENMLVLYNGCDTNHFNILENNRIGKHTIQLCWYGLWEDEKGIFDVLHVMRIIKNKGLSVSLTIGGSAAYEGVSGKAKEIEERVHKEAKELQVYIRGTINYSALPVFINDCHVGLFLSKYREPMANVPLEMMACGLPVIAYAVGGALESIVDNETGFLVENGKPALVAEKVIKFVEEPGLIEVMGAKARKHIEENFALEKHYNRVMEIYAKVAATSNKQ